MAGYAGSLGYDLLAFDVKHGPSAAARDGLDRLEVCSITPEPELVSNLQESSPMPAPEPKEPT